MKSIGRYIFISILLVTLFIVWLPGTALAQTTWYVDDDYGNPYPGTGTPTDPFHEIQLAVNAASTMVIDTIQVADGDYNEFVDIDRSLILRGAQAGNDARTPRGPESEIHNGGSTSFSRVLEVQSGVSSVTIDGFKIVGSRGAVYIQSTHIDFSNNVVAANDYTGGQGSPATLVWIGNGANNINIRQNNVSPTDVQSSQTNCMRILYTGAATIVVDDNHFHQASSTGLAITDNNASTTISIDGNEIDDNTDDGIAIWNSIFNTLSITNNNIHNNTERGINAPGNTGSTTIYGNTIVNNRMEGVRLENNNGSANVNCNEIWNNSTGLNGTGASPIVDAESNWWGCSAGPGNPGCNSVSGNVDYDPWNSTDTGGSISIATFTSTGTATLSPNYGSMRNVSAVDEGTLDPTGKPDLEFPHGFFAFDICCLTPGQTVTVTLQLPSYPYSYVQYWKFGPTPSDPTDHWYTVPMTYNPATNTAIITLVDGGLGDDDLTANGLIIDQGGPGHPAPTTVSASAFPNMYIGILAACFSAIFAYYVRKQFFIRV